MLVWLNTFWCQCLFHYKFLCILPKEMSASLWSNNESAAIICYLFQRLLNAVSFVFYDKFVWIGMTICMQSGAIHRSILSDHKKIFIFLGLCEPDVLFIHETVLDWVRHLVGAFLDLRAISYSGAVLNFKINNSKKMLKHIFVSM